jgi:hypothetical protein
MSISLVLLFFLQHPKWNVSSFNSGIFYHMQAGSVRVDSHYKTRHDNIFFCSFHVLEFTQSVTDS